MLPCWFTSYMDIFRRDVAGKDVANLLAASLPVED
jgi:hypothetical protein